MADGKFPALSVGVKVLSIVGLCLICLVVVSGYAIVQMKEIGAEIEAVAEQDIPLTEILTKITTHQLEQSLNLERAARYGEKMASDSHAAKLFKQAKEKFDSYSEQVNSEILIGEKLAEEAASNAHSEEERVEFNLVLDGLKKIEVAHKEFETHAEEVFHLLETGKLAEAIELEEKVEIETEELNHELEALLTELGNFTRQATLNVEDLEQSTLRVLVILTLAILAFAIILSLFLVRRTIANPMKSIVVSLESLLAGDTSTRVESHSNDEIGKIAQALEVFREKLIENQKLQDEAKEQQQRSSEENRNNRLDMANDLENTVGNIISSFSSAVSEMNLSAQNMSQTAQETDRQAMNVASASDQASQNVQTVASATEELSVSVREITRQVQESTSITAKAVNEGKSATQTVEGMAEMANKIGSVVSLINDIAEQTNLLALNATIEAARAGDAGKGFAVVASEVKHLANQTASATQEISEQVSEMQVVVGNTTKAIESISDIINRVNDITTQIAGVAEEQEAATQEIARNVQEAAQGTMNVSTSITEVKNGASNTGQNAQEVLVSTSELATQATTLQNEIDQFLNNIRAV